MSYLVLARKYRPQTFGDLVGQPQVRHSLSQALRTGRVAHAYLFTGPRGVGKTTAARLLAMALSCSGPEDSRPCGECPTCLEIQGGLSVDVIEVDGASNRGIDDIRALRDSVRFQPTKNRFKTYIIDEVHALTSDAFNALLKTLEEPPPHAVFIFATTEAQKVPATILSRCQRYDFKRLKVADIAARLQTVAKSENIPFEGEALTLLAKQAEGGMRDALGLADQVIAATGELTVNAVSQSLGLIRAELISLVAESAFSADCALALKAVEEAYKLGADFKELALKSLERVRDLTILKASPAAAEFLDLTDAEESRSREVIEAISLPTLHRHLEAWLKIYAEIARHPQPRWLLEAHLLRLCQMAPMENLAKLAARLTEALELSPEKFAQALRIVASVPAPRPIPLESLTSPEFPTLAAPAENGRALPPAPPAAAEAQDEEAPARALSPKPPAAAEATGDGSPTDPDALPPADLPAGDFPTDEFPASDFPPDDAGAQRSEKNPPRDSHAAADERDEARERALSPAPQAANAKATLGASAADPDGLPPDEFPPDEFPLDEFPPDDFPAGAPSPEAEPPRDAPAANSPWRGLGSPKRKDIQEIIENLEKTPEIIKLQAVVQGTFKGYQRFVDSVIFHGNEDSFAEDFENDKDLADGLTDDHDSFED
ncbi:MAG: DNA polymerase III subunit gamma/tau [Deltaproteobacteria bacterium]|nr:DNA polymerase III subunit gamma/tau [Deltaproteobacteria bacterium]